MNFENLLKIKVLYVEDDKNTREEIKYFLEKRVEKLYLAENGEEGFNLYKEVNPDIIITDLQMPKLSGIEMSKLIRKENSNIPIIITTAFNDLNYLFEGINIGVTSYLTKPLNLKLLIESLISISKNIFLEIENKEIFNTLKQYKDIVDESAIVSKTNLEGIITYINEPFEKISGYKKEELIGQSHNIIRHPDVEKSFFTNIWHLIKDEKKSWQGKIKNISKDGYAYYLDILIKPILDLNGEVIEYISLANDITYFEETKEYFKEQTIKKSLDLSESVNILNQYKDAINESNMIIRLNTQRVITYVNDSFASETGFKKEDLIYKPYSILKQPTLNQKEYEEKVENIFSSKGWRGQITNETKSGKLLHCDVVTFPLKNLKGEIIEYLGIRHNITEIVNLHEELEETQREIIYKLGDIGESRSQETGNHVKRVAEYSKLIAIKLNMSSDEISTIFTASPMHDIGKVGIPDAILNKPSKLNEEEWEIMKTHSEIGYEILKTSTRPILQAAAIISYTHHEKWDGTGYPKGLKGEDIHIYGRITALADVFDALGSNRTYKKAWPLEDILALFKEQKGKHFDPKLVDLFMDNLDEFLTIRNKFKD
ncbi:regulator [Malaciobacter mytili LMG 24559]|uniref:Regulator n=1 Tax=Malaciobacter mytili LMG 24559 TaxID=1032238 RepID=A0AAX2AG58_9BACT|nr:HD domain-containing phosphohydrolase [Malaciobacter mytili]AXH14177.1 multi-sensor domain-containing response regulator c-di-GMP phosphodiesterase, RpfG family [Malaciobacter mytili LMG 24559]RXK15135.1 regulator [Malaciobacter mytili LMG 24559]